MRRIRFAHKRNRGCWGKAYPDQYRIEIDPSLDEKTALDISLHEGLHVLFPMIDEDVVNTAGKTLADLLWRLGYRLKDEDDRWLPNGEATNCASACSRPTSARRETRQEPQS